MELADRRCCGNSIDLPFSRLDRLGRCKRQHRNRTIRDLYRHDDPGTNAEFGRRCIELSVFLRDTHVRFIAGPNESASFPLRAPDARVPGPQRLFEIPLLPDIAQIGDREKLAWPEVEISVTCEVKFLSQRCKCRLQCRLISSDSADIQKLSNQFVHRTPHFMIWDDVERACAGFWPSGQRAFLAITYFSGD
ncbi:hypothetical protein D3C71_1396070 [compost metagenome]